MYENELVKTPADLYSLTYEDIIKLEGFKDTSSRNVIQGIEESKHNTFETVLFSLGIRFVGKTVAEKLALHFKNIENIVKSDFSQLVEVDEIGDRIAQSVIEYFKEPEKLYELERLKKAGLIFEISKEAMPASNTLDGQLFVISGVFENFSREELKTVIKNHGGKITSSISSKTDYLVAGDNMGPSKKEKAEKLGVQIYSEQDLLNLIE